MENSSNFGKNSSLLDDPSADISDSLTCWNDLYDQLMAFTHDFVREPSPQGAMLSIAVLSSFVLALKDLPDEGDVVAIAKHMRRIMLEQAERTGLRILSISVEEVERQMREIADEAARDMLEAAEAPLDRKFH